VPPPRLYQAAVIRHGWRKKVEFCSDHKRDRMVYLKGKRCLHHGCTKRPFYGVDGSTKSKFCVHHASPGMTSRRSERPSSESQDSTGLGREHGDSNAVSVVTQRARVGEKRKGRDPLSPTPAPTSSSSGASCQQAGEQPVRARTIPSVPVPVKEEAAADSVSAAGPRALSRRSIVFPARKTAAARAQGSSSDAADRVKAEVAAS